jgi:hypothetical protein
VVLAFSVVVLEDAQKVLHVHGAIFVGIGCAQRQRHPTDSFYETLSHQRARSEISLAVIRFAYLGET